MTRNKGGHCGLLEDTPDAALTGHSPHLLGQHGALLMCNREKPLLGQPPQYNQVGPHVQFTANMHNLGLGENS